MKTGEFPRAMAEVARHRTVAGARDAIARVLVDCGAEHVQVWLDTEGEGTFVEQGGHASIFTLPLVAHDDGPLGALVVRVSERLAAFQMAHLDTFVAHAAAVLANARAFEAVVLAEREAQVALTRTRDALALANQSLRAVPVIGLPAPARSALTFPAGDSLLSF